ncbi:sporulation factor SpoIIGA [Clostridium acetireducens DSM 10703]|uniref:Sporulation sigma-E factor-processing peptidase n=1 Tax=Clostridium acetireducens DSM 10703 TaxID=1121290 RepID=A0A1E8EXD9_9CLOT|nr:sigma-E processing peptidase SpoIIGA [Clostridium acetireducens]OFI05437.1 sporulation factor SpoIIGA [Clostridium acetireducens DSM 10703]
MEIYLDVLLVENCIINVFLMYVTSQTIKIKVNFKYIFLSGFIGSIYLLCILLFKSFYNIVFKLIVAFVMTLVCFRKKNILFNLKASIILILYAILLAGMCIFIEFNNKGYMPLNGVILNFSCKKLIISIMIIYMLIDRIIIYIKDRKEVSGLIYDIDIILNNSNKKIKAFLDTGNELREPVTNLPVIVAEKEIFNGVNISNYSNFKIPYRVVNGCRGSLIAFKPNYIKIYKDKKGNFKNEEVIIALTDCKLSDYGDYNALLSRGII